MEKPIIVNKKPQVVECESGSYFWCACGKSSNQPFCDGAHKGSGFSPTKVVINENKTVAWCMCKNTKSSPFCDGTHSKL